MDGNGRWAKSKGMPRNYGHTVGAKNVETVCQAADELGIEYLTLYAFSTENWNRPKREVSFLFNTLEKRFNVELKKMMKNIYDTDDAFFKEIDSSIRKNCHKLQDVNVYLIQFQNFTQDLMMLMGNLMKFKLRLPSFMKNSLYKLTAKTVEDIFTKNDFSDASVLKTVLQLRQFNKRLAFSQQWVTDFTFQVLMLAKKEPRPSDEDVEKAKQKMGK